MVQPFQFPSFNFQRYFSVPVLKEFNPVRVSVKVTFSAASGPVLVMVMV